MAEPKTKATRASVTAFLDRVADAAKRADCYAILRMMRQATGEPPRMWGPSIIGFGSYHYKYDSGHEGDACRMGFSPRGAAISLYLMPGVAHYARFLKKLGKHKTGKACLYIKRLSDVDLEVLEALIIEAARRAPS